MAEEDPLIQALPPATDYLTYLTLLEYQLTPARLPTLHKLLQDEVLTTNIGWDLVQLLLPMLPQSLDCLHDIARLGNPREVILRVSEALMQLQPEGEEEESETSSDTRGLGKQLEKTAIEIEDSFNGVSTTLPRHILQFNCLVAMLSTLHSRIQTKYPSRFMATSLQAALEAYTLMPTSETTTALLEFFRDVSPSKRPAPPPRAPSDSSVLRVVQASAPDPEAEVQSPSPNTDNEKELVSKYLQFGLFEMLKSYLLSLSSPVDPGMSWTVRLQEKLHPELRMPNKQSQTDVYESNKDLKQRDMLNWKIIALSRDLGFTDEQLLTIVRLPPESQPPQLDFEELPKKPEEIPLERHGALLLLAARAARSVLFSSGQETESIPVFPDLARIYANFVGEFKTPDDVAFGQPQVLLDSLLTLTVLSVEKSIGRPADEKEFKDFVLAVTACASRQSYGTVRRIPAAIFHSHPSQLDRFKLLRQVLEDSKLHSVRESAIGWLKDELLNADTASPSNESNIFLDPHHFSVLFPLLFNSSELLLNVSSDIVASWIKFSQTLAPSIHAALSLYYVLVSSPTLRQRLQLDKTYMYFRNQFLEQLKSLCHAFESDMIDNGGEGRIEAAVGENMCQVGMARSVGVITQILEQVEDAVGDAFVVADAELQEPTAGDMARVDQIRAQTAS